jgi:general secretion pathway protein C
MWIRFVTFFVWLAVGASAVAWMLPMFRPAPGGAAPGASSMALDGGIPPADWSALLTRAPAAAEPPPVAADASRFRLVGVAGPLRASGQGVALLSIDGKAPRALRTGEVVEGNRVVLEVTAHTVKIGVPGGPPTLTLQAPLLPPPATGVPPGFAG